MTNLVIDKVWPRTDTLFNDWGAHLQWAGMFAAGVLLAGSADAWNWMETRRTGLMLLALLLCADLLADHAFYLNGMMTPPVTWVSYDVICGLFGWITILTACGFAAHYLNQPSPALRYLNTAILPVYVLHQPILFLAAYLLFPLALPLGAEALLLTAITFTGALAIYHVLIRPFAVMRFFFGLKQPEPQMPLAIRNDKRIRRRLALR
jgi:hypothetical protein